MLDCSEEQQKQRDHHDKQSQCVATSCKKCGSSLLWTGGMQRDI